MENQNNNKVVIALLIVIIIILTTLCVLFATGTISLNSNDVNNNEINQDVNNENQGGETGNNTSTENNENLENEKLPGWVSYLLKQNIKNITVHRTFKGEGFDPSVGCLENKNITNENLTQILERMTKGELTKYLDAGGFGGPCLTNIVIEYNENEKLELFLYKYIITKDEKILSLLEKEEYIENNTYNSSIDNPNTLFAYDWDDSFVESLFK